MTKKIVVSMLLMAALAASGCKKKAGDDKTGAEATAVVASPECKDAGEHVQELMLRTTKADAPDDVKSAAFGKSREAADQVAAACTKDKWTADGIACVKTTERLADCSAKLTPAQQKSLPTIP
jgi:hypothetical protein